MRHLVGPVLVRVLQLALLSSLLYPRASRAGKKAESGARHACMLIVRYALLPPLPRPASVVSSSSFALYASPPLIDLCPPSTPPSMQDLKPLAFASTVDADATVQHERHLKVLAITTSLPPAQVLTM